MKQRICHLCLNGPYNEGWNYQENLLPKYHAKLGFDVYQIVTPFMWQGTSQVLSSDKEYVNDNGVHVFRCGVKKCIVGGNRFNRYPEAIKYLDLIHPDILFIHDVQCLDMAKIARFLKKNPTCKAFADNHSDFYNSGRNWISRVFLHKIIWRHMAQLIKPYVTKYFGVLPARVDFLVNVYKIPKEKVDLLVMGADDDLVQNAILNDSYRKIRSTLNIESDDFLIVTGGKINYSRPEILTLMQAIDYLGEKKVKLLIFGAVEESFKENFEKLLQNNNIIFVGWASSTETYDYISAANLVVFPGLHSVMWEQAVGSGKPCIFKDLDGFHHVDLGGNCLFFENDTIEEYVKKINLAIDNIHEMTSVAKEKGLHEFSYKKIALKSIGII